MGIFFNIINYDKAPAFNWRTWQGGFIRRAAVETFARERDPVTGEVFNTAHFKGALGYPGFTPPQHVFAPWKLANPFKWLEFLACLSWRFLDELVLIPMWNKPGGKLSWKNPVLYLHGLSYIARLAYEILRWFTSPLNHVLRPMLRSSFRVWGFALTVFCIPILVFGVFWFPALIGLSALVAQALALTSAIAMGVQITLCVSIIAMGLNLVFKGARMMLIEFFRDLCMGMGVPGYGGYDEKTHHIAILTRECRKEAEDKYVPFTEFADNVSINFSNPHSLFNQSSAYAFCLFNLPLRVPVESTYPGDNPPFRKQHHLENQDYQVVLEEVNPQPVTARMTFFTEPVTGQNHSKKSNHDPQGVLSINGDWVEAKGDAVLWCSPILGSSYGAGHMGSHSL